MGILRLVAILLLIILVIVVGNSYVTNKVQTHSITSNETTLNFVKIGNAVKVKVTTTIEADDVIGKTINLSSLPDWAKPSFESDGTICNSNFGENWARGVGDLGFVAEAVLYASLIKNGTNYSCSILGGNALDTSKEMNVFLYYLCE